jgi:hypothetical protein
VRKYFKVLSQCDHHCNQQPDGYNDLFEAHQAGHNLESWYNKEVDKKEYLESLHSYVKKYMNLFKQKDAASLIKLIENYE